MLFDQNVHNSTDRMFDLNNDEKFDSVSNGKLLAEETACYFRRFLRSTAFYFR